MISEMHLVADGPVVDFHCDNVVYAESFWTSIFANQHLRKLHLTVRPTVFAEHPCAPVRGSVALMERFWDSLMDTALFSSHACKIEEITIALDDNVWVRSPDMGAIQAAPTPSIVLDETLASSLLLHHAEAYMVSVRPLDRGQDWKPLQSLRSLTVPSCMLGPQPELAAAFLRLICPNAALPACAPETVEASCAYLVATKQAFLAMVTGGSNDDSTDF